MQRAAHVDRRTRACYVAHRKARHTRVLGTVHLAWRTVDEGSIAHEVVHAIFDWMKVRRMTVDRILANEETAARWAGRLTRRCVREVNRIIEARRRG